MHTHTRIRAELVGGTTRLVELSSEAPIAARQTPDGLYLVNSAQGLLSDDEVVIEVVVGAGADLCIKSAAAMVAYASQAAKLVVRAALGPGAFLEWHPEPLIATSRCALRVDAWISLDDDAAIDWREECVLGRTGEEPGSLSIGLRVDRGDEPLLRHDLVIGTALPGWDGPAVVANYRAIGQRLLVSPANDGAAKAGVADQWVTMPLEGGGVLVSALGADLLDLHEQMDAALRVFHEGEADQCARSDSRSGSPSSSRSIHSADTPEKSGLHSLAPRAAIAAHPKGR